MQFNKQAIKAMFISQNGKTQKAYLQIVIQLSTERQMWECYETILNHYATRWRNLYSLKIYYNFDISYQDWMINRS